MLVVLLAETRAWELTWADFRANVLDALGADLALCVGATEREDTSSPPYQQASYIWSLDEPTDWGDVFEEAAGNREWETLLEIDDHLFGGIESDAWPQAGSGAIVLFFRYFLKQSLTRAGVIDDYDWFVITRSDFMWPVPHPSASLLDPAHLYALDGEQYGGISDRHIVVPRRHISSYLDAVTPMLTEPHALKARLMRLQDAERWPYINPERFLAAGMMHAGLWPLVRYLPYVPYAVRAEGAHTRWSEGVYDEGLGVWVKYPSERRRSQIAQHVVNDQQSWDRYLHPLRGVPARVLLRLRYEWAGLRRWPTGARRRHGVVSLAGEIARMPGKVSRRLRRGRPKRSLSA